MIKINTSVSISNTECLREKPRDVEWNELNAMKLPLLLNYAQCKLLLEDYYAVIEHCSSVLEFEQGMNLVKCSVFRVYLSIIAS